MATAAKYLPKLRRSSDRRRRSKRESEGGRAFVGRFTPIAKISVVAPKATAGVLDGGSRLDQVLEFAKQARLWDDNRCQTFSGIAPARDEKNMI